MKTLLFTLLAVFSISDDLALLNRELELSASYDARHEQRIDSLRSSLRSSNDSFETYLALTDAYASYRFDSAYYYTQKTAASSANGSYDQQVTAKVMESFIYFSAGLFKEAHDVLASVDNIQRCSRLVQAKYYQYYSRLCFDLGIYAGKQSFYKQYTERGIALSDRQLDLLTPADTVQYYYTRALQSLKLDQHKRALRYFEDCLSGSTITDHERAIAYSSMSYPAGQLGERDLALHYMIMAAIYDIRSSTKEGIALREVASMLHERGQNDEALRYITRAKADADFYGARHRQMEVSQMLPIIEHEQLRRERIQQIITIVFLVIVCIFVVVLITVLIYLKKKLRALAEAKEAIEKMNRSLSELGKIKEEYIGTFLSWQSDMIRDSDLIRTHLIRLARERDLKGIVAYIDAIPKQNRRQEFMDHFDRMFLHICPSFVENFNALLLPEYRITPKDGELLTTELRIFALIRLGITSNEKIAQVLDYSVNTVYTYKTKMRNRSRLASDAFYLAAAEC